MEEDFVRVNVLYIRRNWDHVDLSFESRWRNSVTEMKQRFDVSTWIKKYCNALTMWYLTCFLKWDDQFPNVLLFCYQLARILICFLSVFRLFSSWQSTEDFFLNLFHHNTEKLSNNWPRKSYFDIWFNIRLPIPISRTS